MKKVTSILVRVLSIALQLCYVKMYTHYLTIAELGYCFYLTALSYATNALIFIPADFYQQAILIPHYRGIFPLGSMIALNRKIALLAAGFATLIGIPMILAGKLSILDLMLTFGLAIFLYFSTSFRNYLNNRGHNLFTGSMLLLEALIKVSSFFFFVLYGMSHVSAFVLSTIAAFLIESMCLAMFFYWHVPFTLLVSGDAGFRSMLQASSAVSFSALCNWLQLQGYRIVYVWLGLPAVAGLYAAVSNLGIMGMSSCSAVFSQMLLPKVYASNGAYIARYMRLAVLLCIGVLLGYVLLGKLLLLVLTKREFEPYVNLMLFGILVEAGNLMIGAVSTYFTIQHTSGQLIFANLGGLLAAITGIAACLTWRPGSYYLLGGVLACSQGIVCAILFLELRRNASREALRA